jgi:hypothetical protein
VCGAGSGRALASLPSQSGFRARIGTGGERCSSCHLWGGVAERVVQVEIRTWWRRGVEPRIVEVQDVVVTNRRPFFAENDLEVVVSPT